MSNTNVKQGLWNVNAPKYNKYDFVIQVYTFYDNRQRDIVLVNYAYISLGRWGTGNFNVGRTNKMFKSL